MHEEEDDGNTRADESAPDGDEDPAARGCFDQGPAAIIIKTDQLSNLPLPSMDYQC